MKTYCELYFRGDPSQLTQFVETIRKHTIKEWKVEEQTKRGEDYLWIDYVGTLVNKARVSIYLGDDLKKGEIRVGNIVPLEKNELSIDEYNAVLKKFDRDLIEPYRASNPTIEIDPITSDVFNPKSVITETALEKLKRFCSAANKSTGSSHPCDQERWLDFICQTVDDGKVFDYSTLAAFLQDEDYWGEKPNGFLGVMGSFAWDEEHALELASEYENACEVLRYYKKTRGV